MSSIAVLRTPPTHHTTYLSSRHHHSRDANLSPSYRSTPPHTTYDSPMLTPSPLRTRILYSPGENDDRGHQSPFDSSFDSPVLRTYLSQKPAPRPFEEEKNIFMTTQTHPLRTPVKESNRTPECTPFSIKQVRAQPKHSRAASATGTKRKVTALPFSTPLPKLMLTPLSVASKRDPNGFDRLAPLPAPRFTAHSPETPAETESSLKRHAESMTKLRICELDSSDEDDEVFLSAPKIKAKAEEVAEAVSPDGHITKRRARSRPVSIELSNSVLPATPSPPEPAPPRFAIPALPEPRSRPQMDRITSSATLFFGPRISPRPQLIHRYSDTAVVSPSTPSPLKSSSGMDQQEDPFGSNSPFFGPDSSFSFSVTSGSPSPRSKAIRKKYKPRDSGVALSDDDEWEGGRNDFLSVLDQGPRASTSVSTIQSDYLVTPGNEPTPSSGWPMPNENVDDFIAKTLAAGTKEPPGGTKKMPNTPVKRTRVSNVHAHVGGRPWQSVTSQKIAHIPIGGVPRKSMPAAFPQVGDGGGVAFGHRTSSNSSEDLDVETSPSARRTTTAMKSGDFGQLGFGRPAVGRAQLLLRRSSSNLFSSGGETSGELDTPSENKSNWQLHVPRPTNQFTTSDSSLHLSPSSAHRTDESPAMPRRPLTSSNHHHHARASSARPSVSKRASYGHHVRYSTGGGDEFEQPGRFERDFVEVEEIGRGEFGKVMKVKHKTKMRGIGASPQEGFFAVKKSKTIEGARHRLRLREEVEILKHLSKAAGGGAHANVLSYVDSWEQDGALFIETELCELGNFAHFLAEYGQHFARLEEARVWKILVDLSDGLRFIHDANVIHLDLKPANIFVTGEGRFKIGDFGMASLWPRPSDGEGEGFEREGDKEYLALEVLQQGVYGKAADIFSLGMTMLETAANIVVPGEGEPWHRLRHEDFAQVELDGPCSAELCALIKGMMRTDPAARLDVGAIWGHAVVMRTREVVQRMRAEAEAGGGSLFAASPLAGVPEGFLEGILGTMDTSG